MDKSSFKLTVITYFQKAKRYFLSTSYAIPRGVFYENFCSRMLFRLTFSHITESVDAMLLLVAVIMAARSAQQPALLKPTFILQAIFVFLAAIRLLAIRYHRVAAYRLVFLQVILAGIVTVNSSYEA